jgi:hypothetical protein
MYLRKNNLITLVFLLLLSFTARSQALVQDSIVSRTILIGDAGEMDQQQDGVITHAVTSVLPGKTKVFYLGDNIYPRGMGLPGSPEEKETKDIISSQYKPFRAIGVPVYFVPGNHDWDKSGPLGLAKVKQQGAFLKEQGDADLALIPSEGCPGPIEIPLSSSLVLIAFDSEWWLFPYEKSNPEGVCECNTKDEMLSKLKVLLERNKTKMILLASHHPFQTYGSHGGYYSIKDHVFPLTNLKKGLYMPLPVVGSLYPLMRTVFANPEDMGHKKYKEMVRRVDSVFAGFPNLVHVAGHDHGLQFIRSSQTQVVSGSAAKYNYVKKGKHALYASTHPGYVVADQLINNYVRFTYYANTGSTFEQVFSYIKGFKAPL